MQQKCELIQKRIESSQSQIDQFQQMNQHLAQELKDLQQGSNSKQLEIIKVNSPDGKPGGESSAFLFKRNYSRQLDNLKNDRHIRPMKIRNHGEGAVMYKIGDEKSVDNIKQAANMNSDIMQVNFRAKSTAIRSKGP